MLSIPAIARGCSLTLLAAIVLPAAVSAQRVDPERLFDLTVQAREQVMTASVRDGGSLRLQVEGRVEYELMPVMHATEDGRVRIAVYRSVMGDPESRTLAERVDVRVGVPAGLRADPSIRVVVDGVRTVPAARQAAASGGAAFAARGHVVLQSNDQCCVCCGGLCACACGVSMSCGSCCMGTCCRDTGGGLAAGGSTERETARRVDALIGGGCEQTFPARSTRIAFSR